MQRAQRGRGDRDRRQQPEAERQDDQEIDVALGDHLVDGELHVERAAMTRISRTSDSTKIWASAWPAPCMPAPEAPKRQPGRLVLGGELRRRREFQRDAGQVLGRLVERVAPLAQRRVVHDDPACR